MTTQERARFSDQAGRHLASAIDARNQTISLFYPIGSEIDAMSSASELMKRGGRLCLPVTQKNAPLQFVSWSGEREGLVDAGFGSKAPPHRDGVLPDIMVLPLLAFDDHGNRLGWGQGHYDRTLAAMAERPLLIGLAFACQRLPKVAAEPHDVPLDLIVTETGIVTPHSPTPSGSENA